MATAWWQPMASQPRVNPPDERGLVRSASVPPVPDDQTQNSSVAIVWDGDEVDYIEETLNGIVYRTTFTYTAGKVTAISAAVQQ